MGETTKIEWADSTLNLWFGCTKVSPACDHCYAEGWGKRSGMVKWGPHEERVPAKHWRAALEKISRRALAKGGDHFVFVNSLSDFFDKQAPDAWRGEAAEAFRQHPHLTILLVTKRIGNAEDMIEAMGGLPPNCAVLITVIDQAEADRDIPKLLIVGAKWRPAFMGLSVEPMLGGMDIAWAISRNRIEIASGIQRRGHFSPGLETVRRITWVIAGGESGPHARPSASAWFRSLRDQCATAGVPYLFKQWGEWAPDGNDPEPNPVFRVGKKAAGRALDGLHHNARPQVSL